LRQFTTTASWNRQLTAGQFSLSTRKNRYSRMAKHVFTYRRVIVQTRERLQHGNWSSIVMPTKIYICRMELTRLQEILTGWGNFSSGYRRALNCASTRGTQLGVSL